MCGDLQCHKNLLALFICLADSFVVLFILISVKINFDNLLFVGLFTILFFASVCQLSSLPYTDEGKLLDAAKRIHSLSACLGSDHPQF